MYMNDIEKCIEVMEKYAVAIEKDNRRLFIALVTFIIATSVAVIFFFGFYFNYSWEQSQTVKNGEISQQIKSGG